MSDMHALVDCSLDDLDSMPVRLSPLPFFSAASPRGIDSEANFNWECLPEPEHDRELGMLARFAAHDEVIDGHIYTATLDAEHALHASDSAAKADIAGTSIDIAQTDAAATDMETDIAALVREDDALAGGASSSPTAPAATGNGRGRPARSRGGGRKASAAGILFKTQFREKFGSMDGAYQFRPSASYLNYFRKIVQTDHVESEISAKCDDMPLHLIEILHESKLSGFNLIKINPAAKMRLIRAFMASTRSMTKAQDVKATWQRITQILADLGYLAVKGRNVSGRSIFSGNSDFYFSIEAWNENGHRCCPGGRGRIMQIISKV